VSAREDRYRRIFTAEMIAIAVMNAAMIVISIVRDLTS
jgi:hypothetical protein